MFLVLLLISLSRVTASPQPPADCSTRDTCRAQALIAEAAGDFERFHDLAWRAVQKSKPDDPELMVMLARAMALSGRPGDAIVMLSRLADMGVKVETSGDEFRVVRTLKDWPDVESKLGALNGPPVTDAAAPAASAHPSGARAPRSATSPEPSAATGSPSTSAVAPAETLRPKTPRPETPKTETPRTEAAAADPSAPEPEFSFDAPSQATSGLAYDGVSRRWLMSDRSTAGLLVIDEISHHVVPLVSRAGAGFYEDLTAFRIDARRGDLWVVSAREDGEHVESVLHKLQLVSGRPIFDVPAASLGDVRLVDVAVDQSGDVYALDAAQSRILRLRPGTRVLEVVTRTTVASPTAFDVVDDRTAFVAGSAGITRVDLSTGRASLLKSGGALRDVSALDAAGGSLFLLQQSSDGARLVRCTLDATGRAIASTRVVDSATAIARAGHKLYYVAAPGVIKSVRERP
jgi:hypothetical protein